MIFLMGSVMGCVQDDNQPSQHSQQPTKHIQEPPNTEQPTPSEEREIVKLSGKVEDTEGKPIQDVAILPEPQFKLKYPWKEIGYLTSKKGTYTVSLEPGPYKITTKKSGYEIQTKRVMVKENTVVNFELKREK
ncbi:carboxypeptidase regulatory-like domain-containing protein [Polycladomyces sp. WAk]|uniref:Carboxypeptidase regulatory-like domain-containing protein n=1 Tax=Polycladomyces zharkentensis TaxID=2807616 RepID=A0ABS2WJ10_9BACL|nr:carboxypeptidase regulatory-like domain-containing protein [Polycladomyces sp. WAk]